MLHDPLAAGTAAVAGNYHPFLIQARPSGGEFGRYQIVPPDATLPALPSASIRWSGDTWRAGVLDSGDWILEIHVATTGAWIPVARLSSDFSCGTIRRIAGRQGAAAPFALNYPIDQAVLTRRLLQGAGVILHACGVVWKGRGLVFTGPSGVGKTTIARLWREAGATLLNDDRVLLRLVDGQPWLFSTPWHGEERVVTAGDAPLAALFHLAQEPENRLSPLTGATAVARTVANCIAPFYDSADIARLLGTLEAILDRTTCRTLGFTPEPPIVEFVDRHLAAP